MKLIVASLIVMASFASQPPSPTPSKVGKPQQQNSTSPQQQPSNDQRGTDQSPLVIKALPSVRTQTEADRDAKDREEKSANDRHIVDLSAILTGIAFLQLLVYAYQAKKLRETVESAGEQSQAMDRHVDEAARSAAAMENIVNVIRDGNKGITRAYLTVIIGDATYQERNRAGQPDLKFEARPLLKNTGNSPARNVRFRIIANVLNNPLPADHQFVLPRDMPEIQANIVGQQNAYIMNATVDRFVPDGEVATIKEGIRKALYVWGTITYDDIFGDAHYTKFCQAITWFQNNTVMGFYINGENDMT